MVMGLVGGQNDKKSDGRLELNRSGGLCLRPSPAVCRSNHRRVNDVYRGKQRSVHVEQATVSRCMYVCAIEWPRRWNTEWSR